MCWPWRKVPKTKIREDILKTCRKYGEGTIQLAVAGHQGPDPPPDLLAIYAGGEPKQHAFHWLAERAASHERREVRMEWMEIAILILLFVEVFHIDVPSLFRSSYEIIRHLFS